MIMVELNQISKSYKNKKILDNFSLRIHEGEYVCLSGESGSGKSTLLNIIGLLEQADEGTVDLCEQLDVKVNSKQARQLLSKKISFLFQNYALVENQTIGYNLEIACGQLKFSKREKVQMKRDALEKLKLDFDLKTKIYQLSGGEQQRIALARVLLKDSELILADEPTAALDIKNRDLVLECLKDLNRKGKTIVMVSHDPYVINQADRVIYLTNE